MGQKASRLQRSEQPASAPDDAFAPLLLTNRSTEKTKASSNARPSTATATATTTPANSNVTSDGGATNGTVALKARRRSLQLPLRFRPSSSSSKGRSQADKDKDKDKENASVAVAVKKPAKESRPTSVLVPSALKAVPPIPVPIPDAPLPLSHKPVALEHADSASDGATPQPSPRPVTLPHDPDQDQDQDPRTSAQPEDAPATKSPRLRIAIMYVPPIHSLTLSYSLLPTTSPPDTNLTSPYHTTAEAASAGSPSPPSSTSPPAPHIHRTRHLMPTSRSTSTKPRPRSPSSAPASACGCAPGASCRPSAPLYLPLLLPLRVKETESKQTQTEMEQTQTQTQTEWTQTEKREKKANWKRKQRRKRPSSPGSRRSRPPAGIWGTRCVRPVSSIFWFHLPSFSCLLACRFIVRFVSFVILHSPSSGFIYCSWFWVLLRVLLALNSCSSNSSFRRLHLHLRRYVTLHPRHDTLGRRAAPSSLRYRPMRRAWLHSNAGGGADSARASQPASRMEVGSKISSSSSPSVTVSVSVLTFLSPLFVPYPNPSPHAPLSHEPPLYTPNPCPMTVLLCPGPRASPPRPLAPSPPPSKIRHQTSTYLGPLVLDS